MNTKTKWIFSTYTGQGKPTSICFVQQLLTQSECFSKLYWLSFPCKTWWSLEPESWTAALLGYFSYPTSAALNYLVVLPSILAHHSLFSSFLSVCCVAAPSPWVIALTRAEFAYEKHLLLPAYSPKDCVAAWTKKVMVFVPGSTEHAVHIHQMTMIVYFML